MFDSRTIVEYLDTLSPVGKLIPGSGRERCEVRTWEALADGVLDAAVLARMERVWVHPQGTVSAAKPGSIARWAKVHAGLQAMEQGLGTRPGAQAATFAG